MVIDTDTAAFADCQACAARQRILRADPGGKDHHIGLQRAAIGEVKLQPVGGAHYRRCRFAGVHANLKIENFLPQHRRAAVIQLHRHQVGGELHHMGLKPQLF